VKYVAAKFRTSEKLGKKGRKQVSAILFISIPRVEVKVSNGGPSSIAQSHDVLDHRITAELIYILSCLTQKTDALPGARYRDELHQKWN
jgi:hypothetical protein